MGKSAMAQYVEQRGHHGVEVVKTADLFRRYAFMEQSCVRALAAWFLHYQDWEGKIRLGYLLFAHAEHVFEHHGRLEELRGGHRNANIEPELNRLGEDLLDAPDEASFLDGLLLVVTDMEETFRAHLAQCDLSANAMEIRVLKRAIPDFEEERGVLRNMRERLGDVDTSAWTHYVATLLARSGGISGLETRSSEVAIRPDHARLEWPLPIRFDARLKHADLGTYEQKMNLPLRERAIGEFEVYFNEFYAAALLATVIYESWKMNAPRQYFLDIAHHFWDEVRHAEFGALRLRELGVEPDKINMMLYDQSLHMPLLHRFCYLTLGLEVFFMPRKSERTRYYEERGDARSQLFADVDWSEEINHVTYGKRWLEYFLKDDARSLRDIQDEVTVYLEAFQKQMPEGRKAPW